MARFEDMPGGEAVAFGNSDRLLIEPDGGSTKWFDYERLVLALDARRLIGCRVLEAGGPQTITSATWTPITFDTDDFDHGGLHDTGSNTDRITIPAGEKGLYILGGAVGYAADATQTGVRQVRLQLNGSSTILNSNTESNPGAGIIRINIVTPYVLDAADYVTLDAYQTLGSNLNTVEANCEFWAIQITKIP